MRNKTSVESTKAATTTETTQVSCRHTVTVTASASASASDFHFALDWTLDRPGSRKIFYDSPVATSTCTAMCTEYGVRCSFVQTSWPHKRAEFLASELTSTQGDCFNTNTNSTDWAVQIKVQQIGQCRYKFNRLGSADTSSTDWAVQTQVQQIGQCRHKFNRLGSADTSSTDWAVQTCIEIQQIGQCRHTFNL